MLRASSSTNEGTAGCSGTCRALRCAQSTRFGFVMSLDIRASVRSKSMDSSFSRRETVRLAAVRSSKRICPRCSDVNATSACSCEWVPAAELLTTLSSCRGCPSHSCTAAGVVGASSCSALAAGSAATAAGVLLEACNVIGSQRSVGCRRWDAVASEEAGPQAVEAPKVGSGCSRLERALAVRRLDSAYAVNWLVMWLERWLSAPSPSVSTLLITLPSGRLCSGAPTGAESASTGQRVQEMSFSPSSCSPSSCFTTMTASVKSQCCTYLHTWQQSAAAVHDTMHLSRLLVQTCCL